MGVVQVGHDHLPAPSSIGSGSPKDSLVTTQGLPGGAHHVSLRSCKGLPCPSLCWEPCQGEEGTSLDSGKMTQVLSEKQSCVICVLILGMNPEFCL